ncbi:hypothetical protein HELRODRAFT_183135 [Helobdella robusta]|uniref:Uncharacterized protein n=1 Tax=Helobdella robusta TaxID=6412 RepID=T1FJ67_HELRO|nr:hypothetical protein HELRODRAFT_183135 [Helobdella robusta]ESO11444.1 hypothetical protein HELRODRAFT_183135 [Helobdella robusta]
MLLQKHQTTPRRSQEHQSTKFPENSTTIIQSQRSAVQPLTPSITSTTLDQDRLKKLDEVVLIGRRRKKPGAMSVLSANINPFPKRSTTRASVFSKYRLSCSPADDCQKKSATLSYGSSSRRSLHILQESANKIRVKPASHSVEANTIRLWGGLLEHSDLS